MRSILLFFIFNLVYATAFSQSESKLLRNIDSVADVSYFNSTNTEYKLQHFVLSNEKEMNESSRLIYENEKRVFQQNGKWIKEIDRDRYTGSHVRYLFLNGEDMDKQELFSLRDSIHRVYLEDPSEAKFIELANKFTMDGNTNGGLLAWYDPMSVVKKFADGVAEGAPNTVFKLDVKSKKWYYLVYKLAEEKEIFKREFVILIKK